ncbi:MAG: mechanosensitive ion channel family protein [Candidatus Marinimicrobia bacterium]|jgi:small-conductance mechanosensitive channel|nr:mechanosensitive ion channel family protein [Candidatus Neomarinimicrobiota bacterium]|tara:strand:+ start:172 stop:1218 length:1047 start_codon:yes stop_codon:yes gene_type:complete
MGLENYIPQQMLIWIEPLATIALGLVLGSIFKKFLVSRLKSLSLKNDWESDDVIINAIDSVIVFWFFLAFSTIAIGNANLPGPEDLYQKIISAFLIISISFTSSKIVLGLLDVWSKTNKSLPSTGIFKGLTNFAIFSLGILFILQSFGISITPLITALGVGGLAVSLALKDTLSDLFGGINILLSKTMQEGDYVQLDNGYQGYVENVGWRYTTIRERANNIISIPNSVLSGSISKNFSSMDSAFRVPIQIGVSYDSDLDHVEKVALEVANDLYENLDCISKSYKPAIRFREFADSSINFFIYFQGKNFGDHNTILNSYIKKLHKRFRQEKIDIPYPIRTLIHKNEIKN